FEREVFLGAPATPDVASAPPAGVHFATDSAVLDAKGKKALDEIAAAMKRDAKLTVKLDGFTDARGSDAHNRALSDRRAAAAKKYLVAQGIAAQRIEVKGYGERSPAADNATAAGRRANRRTEIKLVD